MDRIKAMRASMTEAGLYSDRDIEWICWLEKGYDEACERIARECEAEGYPSHGSNYELRCEAEREWYDGQIKEITEPYEEEQRRSEEMMREITEKYGLTDPYEAYSPLQQKMLMDGYYALEYIESYRLREEAAEQWYKEQLPGIEWEVSEYRQGLLEEGFYSIEDVERLCKAKEVFEVGCAAANRDCMKEGCIPHGQEYSDRQENLMMEWLRQIDEVNEKYGIEPMYGEGEECRDEEQEEEEEHER